ncbi:hypothetical protein Ahy_A06g029384 [Arachis hypogaea]|uniref:Transposase MuDR plant domain-containing protein n=1 Tax=Arachis hypogaea TaxID=3818 RepID=A0A445CT22_ARAHY|nr:hypothetical protein Ahy_A06g029384 [Arachis hypogaea]
MPIVDEASMQHMFHIHQQTQMQQQKIELYVEFEYIVAKKYDRVEVYKGMNSDNKEEFEANYEAGDENDDGDKAGEAIMQNTVVQRTVNQSFDVPPFTQSLDLDVMDAPKFSKYTNICVVVPKDDEFRIGMEYRFRQLVVATIRSYTIFRGVDYTMYEFEPQTFYAKCKIYGCGCDWLIRNKDYWEIRRYNKRHTCTIRMISQDHFKLDSDTVAEAIRPLVGWQSKSPLKKYSVVGKNLTKLCQCGIR